MYKAIYKWSAILTVLFFQPLVYIIMPHSLPEYLLPFSCTPQSQFGGSILMLTFNSWMLRLMKGRGKRQGPPRKVKHPFYINSDVFLENCSPHGFAPFPTLLQTFYSFTMRNGPIWIWRRKISTPRGKEKRNKVCHLIYVFTLWLSIAEYRKEGYMRNNTCKRQLCALTGRNWMNLIYFRKGELLLSRVTWEVAKHTLQSDKIRFACKPVF